LRKFEFESIKTGKEQRRGRINLEVATTACMNGSTYVLVHASQLSTLNSNLTNGQQESKTYVLLLSFQFFTRNTIYSVKCRPRLVAYENYNINQELDICTPLQQKSISTNRYISLSHITFFFAQAFSHTRNFCALRGALPANLWIICLEKKPSNGSHLEPEKEKWPPIQVCLFYQFKCNFKLGLENHLRQKTQGEDPINNTAEPCLGLALKSLIVFLCC